ncbi:uncharacterized protein FOMMEDRAFT_150979 [Fomitiporia mediterranea MF3/22]|uniref:uncharacterized protein n=1 Tax=Fomitiporia mediterranea (strain MF3/22) TaxID=694068 RepID=UPI0004408E6D|nr:uncharacterized protein FOMMEDRAFT_150979 [Fomitiporia mediterranea MF3/22]EJD08243.1 hypothetical protein FOMMEDRAFT_150979 [Fomitiporia mediterranea MF3/22]
MVSIEYLRAARIKQQLRTSKFDLFGDEGILDGYPHMSMFKFLDEDLPPLPAPIGPPKKNSVPVRPPGLRSPWLDFVELHRPRPRDVPAHIEALARFEEMAQTMDCAEFVANGKGMKKPAAREPAFKPLTKEEQAAARAKWAMIKATKPDQQEVKRERVFFTPEEKLQMQLAHENTSKGLTCISPSFLDNFPGYAASQTLLGHGPHPEDLPKPSFVLTSASIRQVVPNTSPTPPLPFQSKTDNAAQEGSGAGPLDYYEDDYPNYSWSEHDSDFDDVEQLEEDNSHIFRKSFDEQSSVHEYRDHEYDEYCTASEYSGYAADDDTFGDEDGSVYAASARASPNPFVFPCPYSSTGSLTYSSSPSPTDCELPVYSGSSEEVEQELSPSTEWSESEEVSNGATRLLDPNCYAMMEEAGELTHERYQEQTELLFHTISLSLLFSFPLFYSSGNMYNNSPFAISSLRRLDIEGPSWTTTPRRGITPCSSCRSGRLMHNEGRRLLGS